MAIPAFHFSGLYRDKILRKEKTASLLLGEHKYPLRGKVLIYISETPDMFDENPKEKRYGEAEIIFLETIKLSDISDERANRCGYKDKDKIVATMKNWFPDIKYNIIITYVEFKILF